MIFVPNQENADVTALYQTPSLTHLLGTDNSGRDVLNQIVQGGKEIISVALIVFSLLATYLVAARRPRLALTALAAGMIFIGLYMIDGVARTAPQFSLADAARFLNTKLDDNTEVIYEGSLDVGSSLVFYLNRKFYLVNQPPDGEMHTGSEKARVFLSEDGVLQEWGGATKIYLIIDKDRIRYWRELLTDRFHIYHQVTTGGTYVVLSNQL